MGLLTRPAVTTLSYLAASTAALSEEMRRDERVWVLGEDVGRGGLFRQYAGLAEEFGPERIVDAPISESAIMGVTVGAALTGTRPVAELRLNDFAVCAADELVNQAAKNRYMFGGQGRMPLVVRQPYGIGRSQAAQHSQTLESWYVHVPGLVVIAPSTPADNYGLLRAAIRCDDPVVYFEHKMLWAVEGDVALGEDPVPIGTAACVRRGEDVTVVAWSKGVHVAMEAAAALAEEEISVEVIDLRSLWPWDKPAVLESAQRTGRLLVVHEAVQVAGFGAEVVATVAQELSVAVRRVGAPRVPVPYSPPLEDEVRLGAPAVAAAVRTML
ncbi:MAG: alpha-ketoacid dehydrogenase subunit beta [Solirubrobacterales bacterium]|nr:alpha-ketoacid dehydrogenase subunit beta [Solirubrobacterales bacterium]